MTKLGLVISGLLASASPMAAWAQQAAPAPEQEAPDASGEDAVEDIVVTGEVPGEVIGDIPPEQQLTPADIRAYGVSNVAELVAELSPQTRSGRGRDGGGPVMLLNGRRVSSFSEIRNLPTEAIERVDILPEEVALKYGYRADQRVVNIVLRPRFRAITGELDGRVPTAGGNSTAEAELGVLRLNRSGRVNVDMEYERSSALLESERDVVRDPGDDRTLVAPSEQFTANAVVARTLSDKVGASFNASLEARHREALLGYQGALPLSRDTQGQTYHAGFTVNGDALPWRWSVTGNYDRAVSRSITDTGLDASGAPRPTDVTRSTSNVANLDALLNGPLAELPAGNMSAALRLGARTSDYDSSSVRGGLARAGDIGRQSGNAQLNLDLPIASRRRGVLDAIGDLTLNGNVEVEQLSDFGTLVTTGYGLSWSPIKQVRLLASVTDEQGAPSAQQLGDPIESTPNVRVFDYVRGESADVIAITGGNPRLGADSRNVLKLGLNAQPIDTLDLRFSADYVRSVTRDQIASFPAATAAVEAAFPDRFVRGADGRLLSVDTRAVNFERAEREELRWGFNLSLPLKSNIQKRAEERRAEWEKRRDEAERTGQPLPERPQRQPGEGGGPGGGQGGDGPRRWGGEGGGPGGPGGGGRGFGGGGGGFQRMMGPNGAAAGRIHFSVYHTLHLSDRVVIRDGLPEIDLLDGGAIGSRGGQPRHEVEMQAGYSKDGLGLRLNGKWQSGTEVQGGTPGNPETLEFSGLTTVGLRAFADLGQLFGRQERWARGMRVTFGVDNLFDSKLNVTDGNGTVPLSYQPDLLDPTGRVVRISVRKLFF